MQRWKLLKKLTKTANRFIFHLNHRDYSIINHLKFNYWNYIFITHILSIEN